ncbi:hypothetical protein [Clostridium botulinum]|uniref:hypothetical protein n=1 Tax=Clostridium botulinum TaxID=1491 RepID=UPI0004D3A37F|nr:hypothetical protein [Clostridium botulinum]KEH96442.1 hypothetical protein Z953_p0016 [Clostridium botulinum D str. 16868]
MNRTYNIFVDNGLYVLANEIDKEIEDITLEDIKNSTDIFAKRFEDYTNCEYYKKNVSMGFQNSAYTQKLSSNEKNRAEKVQNQYNLILSNIDNDEHCSVCGEKHIKLNAQINYISSFTRCLMPHIHANTFVNYINNLQIVNICPVCLFLSMLSIFNFNKTGDRIILYNSDNNEFMKDYTYEKQIEVKRNIIMCAKECKEKTYYMKNITETIEKIVDEGNKYNGYIEAISFINSAQNEGYDEYLISSKDLKFMKNLTNKSLRNEFQGLGFFRDLITRRLQSNYTSCVLRNLRNSYNDNLSSKLLNEIEEEYSKLKKEKLDLIKEICEKIYETNDIDEIKELKSVDSGNKFEELLIEWNESYKDKKKEDLFDIDQYNMLVEFKEFKSTKNRMIIGFMNLNK